MTDEKTVIEIPLNQKLVEAREAKGLSKEDVCSQLNLSLVQLDKLESDSLDPAELTFFERGYVRNYATFLEMDKAEYEHFFPQGSDVHSELHSVRRYSVPVDKPLLGSLFIKLLLIIVIILAVGFMVNELLSRDVQTDNLLEQVESQLDVPQQLELP